MKALKTGVGALLAVIAVALLILRVTGSEPADTDPNVVMSHGLDFFVRPGLWQRGEVVRTPVADWSFVQDYRTIVLETQTPYFIPHSVRVSANSRNGQLYIGSGQYRMDKTAPWDKFWTGNVTRDPRVRVKIGDKIYELTLVLIANRADVEALFARNPEYWEKGPDGQERQVGYQHFYHAFQRNIAEFGTGTLPRVLTGLPKPSHP
jgi:hypothetical protein